MEKLSFRVPRIKVKIIVGVCSRGYAISVEVFFRAFVLGCSLFLLLFLALMHLKILGYFLEDIEKSSSVLWN